MTSARIPLGALLVGIVAAAGAIASDRAVAPSAAATPEKDPRYVRGCWRGREEHPWPFTLPGDPERGAAGNSPACRTTPQLAIVDRTPRGSIELGQEHRTLKPTKWPVLDSLGNTIAEIEMRRRGKWTIQPPAPQPVHHARRVVILVKGRICAAFRSRNEYVHVRISVRSPARADLGFGGLIARAALPKKPSRNAGTGCGKPVSADHQPAIPVGAHFALEDARRNPTYISERSARGKSPARVLQLPGEGLRNYFHELYGTAELAVSTTAVDGGGYVRAILPVTAAFEVYDSFAYADPNRPCTSRDGVVWSYGRAFDQHGSFEAWGWLPRWTQVEPRACRP